MRDIIHCIGDSHTNFFTGTNGMYPQWPLPAKNKIPLFKTYFVGPALAYNLHKTGTKTNGREHLHKILSGLEKDSRLLLSFGEIDCRIHIYRQSLIKNISIDAVIRECCEKYIQTVVEIKKMGFEVMLWGVTPSLSDWEKGLENKFPAITQKQINQIKQTFNGELSIQARNNGIPLLSIFDELVNSQLETKARYFMDGVHLSQSVMPITIKKINSLFPNVKITLFRNNLLAGLPFSVQFFIFSASSEITHQKFLLIKNFKIFFIRIKKILKIVLGENTYQKLKNTFKK